MKKFVSAILVIVMVFTLTVTAFAAVAPTKSVVSEEIIQLDDGYMVVTINESVIQARADVRHVFGDKKYSYYNSNDVLQWTFTLQGDFTITTGVKVVCTNTNYTYSVHSSAWRFSSANTYPSGNKAYGNATFGLYVNGIFSYNQNCSVTLTCDGNGNLS